MTTAIITIGYYHFALPVADATKVIELLAKAKQCDDAYDHEAKRRGKEFRPSYWHYKTGGDIAAVRVQLHSDPIEPERREELPEEEASSEA